MGHWSMTREQLLKEQAQFSPVKERFLTVTKLLSNRLA
jgi:hypothetical protein